MDEIENMELEAKRKRDLQRIHDKDSRYYMAGILPWGDDEKAEMPFITGEIDPKPVMLLRPLSKRGVTKYLDGLREGMNIDKLTEILVSEENCGIVGLRDFRDRRGKEIPFSREAVEKLPASEILRAGQDCLAYATGILPEEAEGLESSPQPASASSPATAGDAEATPS